METFICGGKSRLIMAVRLQLEMETLYTQLHATSTSSNLNRLVTHQNLGGHCASINHPAARHGLINTIHNIWLAYRLRGQYVANV